jgi:hypothetical protein
MLGGAFPKRHHVDCGMITIICKVPVLGRHNPLVSVNNYHVLQTGFDKIKTSRLTVLCMQGKYVSIASGAFSKVYINHYKLALE